MPTTRTKEASPFAQILGSYATGTSYVPKTGAYQLHQGEAVIPKAQNPVALQSSINNALTGSGDAASIQAAINAALAKSTAPAVGSVVTPVATQQGWLTNGRRMSQFPMVGAQNPAAAAPKTTTVAAPAQAPAATMASPPKVATTAPVAQAQPQGTRMSQFEMGTTNQSSSYPQANPVGATTAGASPNLNTARMQNMGALMAPQNSAYLQGANANLNHIMRNPESMGAGVQAQIFNAAADSRDRMLADQQRQIKEGLAGTGMSNSGLQQSLLNQARSSRNTDLTDAMRQIYTQAATQNFQDRLNVAGLGQNQQGLQLNAANSAYQQQQGLANTALQQQALQNEMFQSDRNYNSQLASMLASLGQQGMTNQIGLVGELGGLIGQGLGYQNSALSQILQQAYQSYAGPDYAPFGYAPNEFASSLMQQSGGGGSSNAELWGSLAGSAGQFLGAGEKPWIFGK